MYSLNLGLRFFLELSALAALAYAGFQAVESLWLQLLLAIGAPLAFAAIWRTFIAPRAPRRLRDPAKAMLEGVLFGVAATALGLTGMTGIAVLFAVIAAGNLALMFALSQREH